MMFTLFHTLVYYYPLGLLPHEPDFLVLLLQAFLGFPPFTGPLLQLGLEGALLLLFSAKLLPGCLQLSSQDPYLLLELTLLLLTTPLEDQSLGTVGKLLKGQKNMKLFANDCMPEDKM